MTAAAFAAQVAASGGEAVLQALLSVPILALVAAAVAVLAVNRRVLRKRPTLPLLPLPPACPCCTLGPLASVDCTCREDCGAPMCQAADPGHIEGCGPGRNMLAYPSLACPACDSIAARIEGGPECPWCDTHECIDRTRCNCAGPCGSWLCMAKEENRA